MLLGLHMPVQGFTSRARETVDALGAEAMLWLPSEQPTDAWYYPDALHMVRLPNWRIGQPVASYVETVAPTVDSWGVTDGKVFVCGNEPDLEASHNGEQFPLYAAALRARWPTIRLANPPLKAENTFLVTDAVCQAADMVACHCYWQINHPEDIGNPNLGGAYAQLLDYGRPVIVTEINCVNASGIPTDTNIDWAERNRQVAEWAVIADEDGVEACALFIADAAPDWAAFDVGPEAAAQIRLNYDGAQQPGDGPGDGSGGPGEEVEVVVNASAVVAMAQSQIGHSRSGTYDTHNGDHAWAYYCQAFVESTHRNLGLTVTASPTAVAAAARYDLSGGRAPFGAAAYFGTSFYYPDGHVGLSMGDGRLLGTLTDGTGVGYRYWNETTNGYLGWAFYDGVVPDAEQAGDMPQTWLVQPNNPYQRADQPLIGIGGGFLRFYNSVALGLEPMLVLGFAMAREADKVVVDGDGSRRDRTVQEFERGTLIYQPDETFPWDVVMKLASQTILDR